MAREPSDGLGNRTVTLRAVESRPRGHHVSLRTIAREWLRIGMTGFGGPPVHIAMLRELCVERRGVVRRAGVRARAWRWRTCCPGQASTQVSIYCAWLLAGARRGRSIGAAGFILPGLALIIALAAVFHGVLPAAPAALAAGLGAAAAVPAVAVRTGLDLAPAGWCGASAAADRHTDLWLYLAAGAAAAATLGPYLVLVLLACGAVELALTAPALPRGPLALLAVVPAASGGAAALAWTALKVGWALVRWRLRDRPADAKRRVNVHHWLTQQQFVNAVALGQVTPGPVLQTVAVVGYGEGGVGGALLAAAVAFTPSIAFVLGLAPQVERLVANRRVAAFISGAAPADGRRDPRRAVPLARALTQDWQFALLTLAAVALLVARRRSLPALLACAAGGVAVVAAGAPL